jgi:CP family cyanate transporter-like MFS transporter
VKTGTAAVLALSWIAAFSLRSGFIGLGPALPAMTADLGLSFSQASFLVAVPTLMMGVMAVPGGALADRFGPARAITVGLFLVTLGGLRAAAADFALLLLFTFLFGAGIGLSQPSLPRLMRLRFPDRLGTTTGVYASGMAVGGIVGAFLSALLVARGGGEGAWRAPIALWGIVAGISLLVWVISLRPWRETPLAPVVSRPTEPADGPMWSPWRDRNAWISALLFGTQGIVYYLLVAWLPAVYAEAGATGDATAVLFTVFNAATLPGMLVFPIWSDRLYSRRLPTIVASVLLLAGVVGLMAFPLAEVGRWLWPALAGCGVAGVFALALVLPAEIAPRGRTGAAAGMVLAVGYGLSALGPVVAGGVRDVTGSFATALGMLPLIGLAILALAAISPERQRETT